MRTGQVIGETNRLAEHPVKRPVKFQEVFATLYRNAGLDVGQVRIFDNSGVLVADVKTRNHGRWVDDPSMHTAVGCPKAYRGRTNQTPLYVPYFATDSYADGKAGGCQTAYGVLSGQHVCNDDSYAQYSNVKNNPFLLQAYATCSDTTLRGTTPTCF